MHTQALSALPASPSSTAEQHAILCPFLQHCQGSLSLHTEKSRELLVLVAALKLMGLEPGAKCPSFSAFPGHPASFSEVLVVLGTAAYGSGLNNTPGSGFSSSLSFPFTPAFNITSQISYQHSSP